MKTCNISIIDHLDIQRIAYYNYLLNMPEHRLCKRIFNALMAANRNGKNLPFDYAKYIRDILKVLTTNL